MSIFRRFAALFSGGPIGIKQASLLLVVTAVLSNILGLVRNIVFYSLIDKGQLDIYYAAFRIPDFLFNLLIFGAITSAFVPLLSKFIAKDQNEEARVFADQTFSWLTVVFGSLAVALAIFMRPLMHLVVPQFDAVRFDATVHLSRILMLQSMFFAWSYVCGGYLNSFRRFASPALAPLIYNAVIIAGAFVAAKTGIQAIAYAVIIGAFLHCSLQFWEMRRTGYRPRWNLQASPEIRSLIRLMIPRSMSQGMSQFVLIVFTALGSGLALGSISILSGMNDLQTTPTVILVNSLAVALFPTLAAKVAVSDWDEVNRLMQKAFRLVLFFLIPSLILVFVLRAQIVRLYFSIGSGTSFHETDLAIATFLGYMIGIIPSAFVILLSRMFYALRNTRTPMILSIVAGLTGITYATITIKMRHGNVANLAIADSIVSLTQCILFLIVIKQQKQIKLRFVTILPRIGQYVLCGLVTGLSAWLTLHAVAAIYTATEILSTGRALGLFVQLVAAGCIGLIVFLGYSRLVLQEELQWIKRSKRFTTNP